MGQELNVYGVDGLLYQVWGWDGTSWSNVASKERIYFAGRLVMLGGNKVVTDRLGSVVRHGGVNLAYYPYGQERTSSANDQPKFGTYTRDSHSGLDYAMNRYYFSNWGRFTTPDPYRASGGPANPQSWNRYAYVEGDPVNFNDPEGLARCSFGGLQGGIARSRCEGRFGSSTHDFATMSVPIYILSMDSTTIGVWEQMAAASVTSYVDRVSEKEWGGKGVLAGLSDLTGRCQGLFNTPDLRTSASRLNFWDGRLHQDGQLQVNDVLRTTNYSLVGNSANYRLYDIHYGVAQAYVLTDGSGQITNQVVLRANFFSRPWKVIGTPGGNDEPWGQNITLVHELLHYHYGLDDLDLAKFLGVPGRFGRDAGAISMWLQAGCPEE